MSFECSCSQGSMRRATNGSQQQNLYGFLGSMTLIKISIFFHIVWDTFFLAKLIFEYLFLIERNFSQLWHWVLIHQFLIRKVKLLLFTLSFLLHTLANQCPSMVATYEDLSLWMIQISIQNYFCIQRILKKLGIMYWV